MKILSGSEREDYVIARQGIGASDVPVIMEEDPWQSAYSLFQIKTGAVEQQPPSEAMMEGSKREPEAIAFAEKTLEITFEQQVIAQHDEHPFLYASADGWNEQTRTLLEVKCPRSRQTIDALRRDLMPPRHYYRQLQQQAAIFEPLEINFMVYHGPDDCELWMADEPMIQEMISDYNRNVLPYLQEFQQAVESGTWPKSSGKVVAEKEFVEHAQKYFSLKDELERLQAESDIEHAALKRLTRAKVAEADGYKAEWRKFSPIYSISVQCVNEDALDRVMAALEGLQKAAEVKKIERKVVPESLRFYLSNKKEEQ